MATTEADEGEPLVLAPDEQDLVDQELQALLPALAGERRARYLALAAAVDEGEVPPELAAHLESLLELALHTARARTLYRAEGEKVLTGLFRRTPAGRDLASQLSDVNGALRGIAGRRLQGARVGMRTLGHFTITLSTDEAKVTLAVRPDGVNVESLEVTDASGG